MKQALFLNNKKITSGFARTLTYVSRRFATGKHAVKNYLHYFESRRKLFYGQRKTTHRLVSGFALIEVILSVSILGLLVIASVGSILYGQEAQIISGTRSRATLVANQTLDVLRDMRSTGFNTLSDGTYGLVPASAGWVVSPTPDAVDGFTRSFTVETTEGGATKKITAIVTWPENTFRGGSVTLSMYLTDWNIALARPGHGGGGGGGGGGSTPPNLMGFGGGGSSAPKNSYRLETVPNRDDEDIVYFVSGFDVAVYYANALGLFSAADATITDPYFTSERRAFNLFATDTRLYVVALQTGPFVEDDPFEPGVMIFDISTPNAPSYMESIQMADYPGYPLSIYVTQDIEGNDQTLMLGMATSSTFDGNSDDNFLLFDVSDVRHITSLGSLLTSNPYSALADISVVDDTAYIATMSLGDPLSEVEVSYEYYAIDISDTSSPTEIGYSNLGELCHDGGSVIEALVKTSITASEQNVYIASGCGVSALDVTDPTVPVITGSISGTLLEGGLVHDFARVWRAGYLFATGSKIEHQLNIFSPEEGLTPVLSLEEQAGIAIAYSSHLEMIYILQASHLTAYMVITMEEDGDGGGI